MQNLKKVEEFCQTAVSFGVVFQKLKIREFYFFRKYIKYTNIYYFLLKGNGRYRSNDHREGDCFNIDDSELNEDFDFEKNLALFDKNAVYDEMFANDGETR